MPQLTLTENLDTLTPDQLHTMLDVYATLGQYCEAKLAAIAMRQCGNPSAIDAENRCDNLYRRLPLWAKSW